MRRKAIGIALALLAGLAQAQAEAPCMLVFGQGRNLPQAGEPDWDDLNQRFNAAVVTALQANGRQVHATTLSSRQVDPQASGLALLAQADKLGCSTGVIYYRIKNGQLTTRRGPGNRLCISWDPATEAACRERIATSGHLNPTARRTRPR